MAPAVARYEVLYFNPDEVRSQAALFSRLGWERPEAGEVELIVLDATGAKIAAKRFKVDGTAAPPRRAAEFIKRHAPAPRDARAVLTAAQREARSTGRRLWLVYSDHVSEYPACADLARWMYDQRAFLAKDYVVLRINQYDDHCEEVLDKLQTGDRPARLPNSDPPWFAIAEPELKVLVTSQGPLGNIGFPNSIEERRHLKKMITSTARHITAAECDRLIESLPKPSP